IDADALGMVFAEGASPADLTYRNLAGVWNNFAAAGVQRLLLAQAVEHRDDLERIQAALGGPAITVGRLTAALDTMRERVRVREPGILRDTFVARVAELDRRLDEAHLEDFAIENDGQSVTDVARELLARAGWIAASSDVADEVTGRIQPDLQRRRDSV